MRTPLAFDAAVEALRGLHIHGDPLPDLAHAAGRSSSEYATGLLAFLAELRTTVETAVRPERVTYHLSARGQLLDDDALPPGVRLTSREA